MATVTEPARVRRPQRYVPGLDGLRGVAVLAVLVYHGGFTWLGGGFLGVSTFFTLSGFLITGLILEDLRTRGRLDFRRFWSRRARRLLPAALLTLGGVLVFRNHFGAVAPQRLRGDVAAGLGYAENWWLVHTNQAYGAIFGASSPVQHFWSLAIEEQYYLLFPVVLYGLHRVLRRRSAVVTVVATAAVASFVLGAVLANSDVTRAYYGTDTRAAELLIGVLLAYALAGRQADGPGTTRKTIDAAAAVALVGLVVLWWKLDLHSATLFWGGTALNALFTAAVIAACVERGVVAAFLSFAPLRLLGMISYGVYLVHWPIFLLLDQQRLDVSNAVLFMVQLGLTIGVATAMYLLLEHPIRRGAFLPRRAFLVATAATTAAVLTGVLLVSRSGGEVVDLASAAPRRARIEALAATTPIAGDERILLVGDSVAWTVWIGLNDWGKQHHAEFGSYTALGCGIGGPGVLRYLGLVRETFPGCGEWQRSLAAAVEVYRPKVVLVVIGLADLAPRRFPNGRFRSLGDATFDAWLKRRIQAMTRQLGSPGARVVWATYPHVRVPYNPDGTGSPPFVENEPDRADRLNELIAAAVTSIPGASVVDFARYGRSRPGGEFDPAYRPDGVHLGTHSTNEVASWLGPKLVGGS